MTDPLHQQSRLKALIAKGKEQGYLTYAEVNDHLPEEIADPDQVEDIIRMIGEHAEYIGHYPTAGNPGRSDLDEMQEISYPAIMRTIHSTGYGGFVGHEFRPKGDPLQALQTTYDLCTI